MIKPSPDELVKWQHHQWSIPKVEGGKVMAKSRRTESHFDPVKY